MAEKEQRDHGHGREDERWVDQPLVGFERSEGLLPDVGERQGPEHVRKRRKRAHAPSCKSAAHDREPGSEAAAEAQDVDGDARAGESGAYRPPQ